MTKAIAIWAALAAALGVPLALATQSDFLEYRDAVYMTAGFAGILALGLLLVQPLLAAGYLPGLSAYRGRRVHAFVGAALLGLIVAHVAGLWVTSPPDMLDALLFRSPTPFSPFGVVALWAIVATALLAALRKRLGLRLRAWRAAHTALACIIVIGSVVHAVLIEGTMETMSKFALCALVLLAAGKVIADVWIGLWRKRARTTAE